MGVEAQNVHKHVEPGYCPTCDLCILHGEPHLCEGGVTPPFSITLSFTFKMDPVTYHKLFGEG